MREFFFYIGVLWCVDEGLYLLLSLRKYLAKNISQNLSQSIINLQKVHPRIWPKMVCSALRVFCYFG